jgi:CHAT domain-containing protein
VPFSALRDRDRPLGQKYLIERHTIGLTSSLRVQAKSSERLRDLHNSSHVGLGSIIALGDPSYGNNHRRLRASGDEVRYIASLFPSESVVTLLEEKATAKNLLDWVEKPSHEPTFRQAIVHIGAHGVVYGQRKHEDHTKSVLHLACHGSSSAGGASNCISRGEQLDDEQEDEEDEADASSVSPSEHQDSQPECQGPSASSDASPAQGSRSDFWMRSNKCDAYDLKAGDIIDSKTKWRAELVVLSACRTSQGKITGEGVLSLARAFMIAGVPCVVASLWNVADQSTSDLMRRFYSLMRTGKLDVASALRSSMLDMLKPNKDRKGPFHVRDWAPFAVWGVPTLRIPDSLQGTVLGGPHEFWDMLWFSNLA